MRYLQSQNLSMLLAGFILIKKIGFVFLAQQKPIYLQSKKLENNINSKNI